MLKILIGDVMEQLATLPDNSVQCCVTSPPYWGLRDYGTAGQIGLEKTPELYVEKMVAVFREVRRVLRDDATLWLNIGDSYNAYNGGAGPSSKLSKTQSEQRPQLATGYGLQCKSLKPKDLCMIPARVALELQADGWYLRSDIIWAKANPMPESVTDRPTKSHEYIFLLAKKEKYYFDQDAVREPNVSEDQLAHNLKYAKPYATYDQRGGPNGTGQPGNENNRGIHARPGGEGRNIRSVWTMATQPYADAHFATFPEELAKRCILAGTKAGDTVLDPFAGSGTTLKVAIELGRQAVGIELNQEYAKMIERRCQTTIGMAF